MMTTQVRVFVPDEDLRQMAGELAIKHIEDDKKIPYFPERIDSIDWTDDGGYIVTLDVTQ